MQRTLAWGCPEFFWPSNPTATAWLSASPIVTAILTCPSPPANGSLAGTAPVLTCSGIWNPRIKFAPTPAPEASPASHWHFPRATALFYGSVKDDQNHPLAGVALYTSDNNQYQGAGTTDQNGNYVAGAQAGDWNANIDNGNKPLLFQLYFLPGLRQYQPEQRHGSPGKFCGQARHQSDQRVRQRQQQQCHCQRRCLCQCHS